MVGWTWLFFMSVKRFLNEKKKRIVRDWHLWLRFFSFTYYQFPKFSLSWQMAWQVDFALIALKATKMKKYFSANKFCWTMLVTNFLMNWMTYFPKINVTLSTTVSQNKKYLRLRTTFTFLPIGCVLLVLAAWHSNILNRSSLWSDLYTNWLIITPFLATKSDESIIEPSNHQVTFGKGFPAELIMNKH